MLAQYTLIKTIVRKTYVIAEDEDDAIEKADAFNFWESISVETEITDIEPIKGPDHVDH